MLKPSKVKLTFVFLLIITFITQAVAVQRATVDISGSGRIIEPNLTVADFEDVSSFEVGSYATYWTSDATAWALGVYDDLLFEPTSLLVHSGNQACNLTVSNPSYEGGQRLEILRDINSTEVTDIWLEGWYYIPVGTPIDAFITFHRPVYERLWNSSGTYNWCQYPVGVVIDSRQGRSTYGKPVLTVQILQGWVDNNYDGANDLAGVQTFRDGDFEVELGQWFKITTYVHRDMENGVFKLWYNDQLIWDLESIRTIGIDPKRIDQLYGGQGSNDAYTCIGFSLYTNIGASPKSLLIDDIAMQITS